MVRLIEMLSRTGTVCFHKALLAMLVALLFFPGGLVAGEIVLKVAYDHWPPWKIVTDDRIGGIDADLLRAMEKRSNFKFTFTTAPWKRCIDMLKQGQVDLITSFVKNQERQVFTDYVHPHYCADTVYLYGLKDATVAITTYEDLYRYRIGAVTGAHYHRRFDRDGKMNKEMAVHEVPLIKMLLAGRIDLIIDWEISFQYIVKKMELHHRIVRHDFRLADIEDDGRTRPPTLYMAFSKKSAMLAHKPRFELLLRSMTTSGEVDKLIRKYVAKPADCY